MWVCPLLGVGCPVREQQLLGGAGGCSTTGSRLAPCVGSRGGAFRWCLGKGLCGFPCSVWPGGVCVGPQRGHRSLGDLAG